MRTSILVLLVFATGCDCGPTAFVEGIADGGSTDGGRSGDGGSGAGAGGGLGGSGGGTSGTGGGVGATAEVCDGVDNDQNGIIDDVDLGHDGVCDCLKIATLGFKGRWGNGSVFSNWLDGKSQQGAVNLEAQTLTPELLARFQVIVVQDVRSSGTAGVGNGLGRSYSQAEIDALAAWVQAGGGVMTLIGYGDASEVVNVNQLLSPYGIHYGSTGVLPQVNGSTAPVTHWATHPLSDNVTRIGVDNGYEVQGGGTLLAWEPNPGDVDVARALELGTGHVLVWGDEWITYDSEWTAHPDYQVERFWLNVLKWLTPANQCQVQLPEIG